MTEEERIALHIVGGIMGIFFHELGHGLIDLLKLPVTGREEDVVDEFATMLLLYAREEGAEYIPEAIYGFADLWRLIGQGAEKTPWWDEHTDAMVRFGNVVCLLYGSSPKEFQELANRFKMPERRQYFCREEYPEKKAAWEKLLKEHLTVYGAQAKGKVTVVYGELKTDFSRKMEEGFRQERVFESLAEGISKGFALPRDITIVPTECGQANAFWDPEKNQIIMCYEMVKLYVDLLDKDLSGGGGTGGRRRWHRWRRHRRRRRGTGGGGGGTAAEAAAPAAGAASSRKRALTAESSAGGAAAWTTRASPSPGALPVTTTGVTSTCPSSGGWACAITGKSSRGGSLPRTTRSPSILRTAPRSAAGRATTIRSRTTC